MSAKSLNNKAIGENICHTRKARHLTQEDVAVVFDNHREYVSRIERGLVDLRLSSLIKIAEALDVKIIDLLCDCETDK